MEPVSEPVSEPASEPISEPISESMSEDLVESLNQQNAYIWSVAQLKGVLDEIRTPGTFAAFGSTKLNLLAELPRQPANTPRVDFGVSVDGVGAIRFPLEEVQAKAIINKARLSPHGQGERTIVDTSVRNTWELNTDQFSLSPTQTGEMSTPLEDAAREFVASNLGITRGAYAVRVEPYKMLLYEPGALFKAHVDSPKIPNMFGTLVVVLPSAHEGGDVIVQHNSQKKVFKSSTSKLAKGNIIGFMCWYSDVRHEVKPIKSGYRWVLTYNLALDMDAPAPTATLPTDKQGLQYGGPRLVAAMEEWLHQMEIEAEYAKAKRIEDAEERRQMKASSDNLQDEIQSAEDPILRSRLFDLMNEINIAIGNNEELWEQKDKNLECMIYGTDHSYTEATLGRDMRGRDNEIVQALRDVSSHLPVDAYLAILEKREFGSCERSFSRYRDRDERSDWPPRGSEERAALTGEGVYHPLDWVMEKGIFIKKMVDLDGNHLVQNLPTTLDNCVDSDPFFGKKGVQTDFDEGYLGNEGGAKATHAYQTTVVVIVPRAKFAQDSLIRLSLSNDWGILNDVEPGKNLQSLVTYYADRCIQPAGERDLAALRLLKHICESAWLLKGSESHDRGFKPEFRIEAFAATCLLQALVRMRDWDFLEKALEKQEGLFMTQKFCHWLGKAMSESASELDFAKLEPLLHSMVLSKKTLSHALFFIQCICPPPKLSPLAANINVQQSETGNDASVAEWARKALEALIDSLDSRMLGFSDGRTLLTLCNAYYGFEYIETRIVPVLICMSKHAAFIFGTLNWLQVTAKQLHTSDEKQPWLRLYGTVVQAFVSKMEISALVGVEALKTAHEYDVTARIRESTFSAVQPEPTALATLKKDEVEPVDPQWLVNLYDQLICHGSLSWGATEPWSEIALNLSRRIVAEVYLLPPGKESTARMHKKSAMKNLWLLLLHGLYQEFDQKRYFSVPLPVWLTENENEGDGHKAYTGSTPPRPPVMPEPHRRVFVAILDAFIEHRVGVVPALPDPPPPPPTRLPDGCCADCDSMNAFLDDLDKSEIEYRINKRRRYHVQNQIRDHKIKCWYTCDKDTIPHTLQIRKERSKYQAAHEEWVNRKTEAERELDGFPIATLQAYLGDDFDRIITMERITDPANGPPAPSNWSAPMKSFVTVSDMRELYDIRLPIPNPISELAKLQTTLPDDDAETPTLPLAESTGNAVKRKADEELEGTPSKKTQ